MFSMELESFIVFLVWFSFKPKKVSAELATIHRGTLIQYVEEEGISRVKEKYSILSPVNGVLKRVEKHAGDVVKRRNCSCNRLGL